MIQTFARWLGNASAYVYAAVFVLTLGEVIARYVFNAPTQWTLELTLILAGLHYLLSGPQASADDTHIRISYFADKIPAPVARLLSIVIRLFMITVCVLLFYYAFRQASDSIAIGERSGSVLNWPMPMIIKAAIAFAFGLMALVVLVRAIDLVRGR